MGEYAGAYQSGRLSRVDADAPGVAHVQLCVHRCGNTGDRDHDAQAVNPRRAQYRLHQAGRLQCRRRRPDDEGYDESDTGPPLDGARPSTDSLESG
jgi:hypothetical protein